MDDINLGLHPWPRLCPLGLMTNYIDCSGFHVFTVELLWTVFYLLLPPPSQPHATLPVHPLPQICWPKIGAHLQKTTRSGQNQAGNKF